ncbi:hypothetical protein DMENIID0001_059580 [Sergentomyia squamirostris]
MGPLPNGPQQWIAPQFPPAIPAPIIAGGFVPAPIPNLAGDSPAIDDAHIAGNARVARREAWFQYIESLPGPNYVKTPGNCDPVRETPEGCVRARTPPPPYRVTDNPDTPDYPGVELSVNVPDSDIAMLVVGHAQRLVAHELYMYPEAEEELIPYMKHYERLMEQFIESMELF